MCTYIYIYIYVYIDITIIIAICKTRSIGVVILRKKAWGSLVILISRNLTALVRLLYCLRSFARRSYKEEASEGLLMRLCDLGV